jgi:uncharacterized ferredoxin-like protein
MKMMKKGARKLERANYQICHDAPMALKDTVRLVGDFMELAARTAPKAVGQDFIEARVLEDYERIALGNDLIAIAAERSSPNWERDGQNVLDASTVVLIGLLPHKGAGLNCGACGFKSCAEFNERSNDGEFIGPNCSIRMMDLGIALGSAAKVASNMNVDNRIMYRIGVSARRLGLTSSNICHGIPLSATGKNIFFDRQPKK